MIKPGDFIYYSQNGFYYTAFVKSFREETSMYVCYEDFATWPFYYVVKDKILGSVASDNKLLKLVTMECI